MNKSMLVLEFWTREALSYLLNALLNSLGPHNERLPLRTDLKTRGFESDVIRDYFSHQVLDCSQHREVIP